MKSRKKALNVIINKNNNNNNNNNNKKSSHGTPDRCETRTLIISPHTPNCP